MNTPLPLIGNRSSILDNSDHPAVVSLQLYPTSYAGDLLAANRLLVDMLVYSSERELRAQELTLSRRRPTMASPAR